MAGQCGEGIFNVTIWSDPTLIQDFSDFHEVFSPIHSYIAVTLCIFGVSTNIINIIVLTRPRMLSGVNAILAVIASADSLLMITYLIYRIVGRMLPVDGCWSLLGTFWWQLFLLIHTHSSIILHTSSLWLSAALAYIRMRYVNIHRSSSHVIAKINSDWRAGLWLGGSTIVFVTLVNLLTILTLQIVEHSGTQCGDQSSNATHYRTSMAEWSAYNDCLVYKLIFWINGLPNKIIPCLLLLVFLVSLIVVLHEGRSARTRLQRSNRRSQQTTNMLVFILMISLLTEVPLGIINISTALFDKNFLYNVYNKLGDPMDLMALTNSAVNFVVYCTMSEAFRTEFWRILGLRPNQDQSVFMTEYTRNRSRTNMGMIEDGEMNGRETLLVQSHINTDNNSITHL